ncbi:MAG: flagellar basal-body MS-ring/collar protein FliF [Caulobacter sp.]
MAGVGIGLVAVLAALLMNMSKQPKELLYANLDLKEASEVSQALDQAGIEYEARGDGSSIYVPRDKVGTSRLMVAGKGLVTSGSVVGYEIFDQGSALGQTDFVQQLNRQRGLEGELARTIRSLKGVTYARVHLVLPKRQLFEEEAAAPSASVTIGIGGRKPSMDQVQAIQNLVAGAVDGLKPEGVTVIDQDGRTLSAGSDGSAAGRLADDRRTEVEQKTAARIKEMVEGVVGPGKARVEVSADIDTARITQQQETFDPDGQVVRSEQTSEENSEEAAGDDSNAVSAAANIPGGAPQAGMIPLNKNTSRGAQTTTNYEISKTIRTEVTEPGAIRKLSVSVAVDGVTAVGADGKPGAYTPRTPEEMAKLDELVKAAVGFDQQRGDQVRVVNVRFARDPATEGGTEAGGLLSFEKNDIMRFAELGVAGLIGILLLFFGLRPVLKSLGQPAGQGGMPMLAGPGGPLTAGGAGGGAIPVQLTIDPATGEPLALPNPEIEQRIDIARIEGQVKASSVKRVSEFVDNHPEESVSILRSWLHETA